MSPCRGAVVLLLLLLLLAACTVPNPDYLTEVDGGQVKAPGSKTDGMASSPAVGTSLSDAARPAPDMKPPAPVTPPTPPPASPGLGTLCTAPTACPSGEMCLFMEETATKGICLRKCANAGSPCSVPDSKFSSGCATYWNTDIGSVQVCVVFCQLNYKTYPCPNATDYKCKSYGQGMGACIPK